MVERFVNGIVDHLVVEVEGLHIRIEDRATCPGQSFALGLTADRLVYKVCMWTCDGSSVSWV